MDKKHENEKLNNVKIFFNLENNFLQSHEGRQLFTEFRTKAPLVLHEMLMRPPSYNLTKRTENSGKAQ